MEARQLAPVLNCLRRLVPSGSGASTDEQLLTRFAASRDDEAFATLVRRHGPLVLAACRRSLGDSPDADDVFQATFLVLARKAATLARPGTLGPWLYGVACRLAARVRVDEARRRVREAMATRAGTIGPDDGPVWRDLRPVLDEEIGRLASRPRAAVVLCYLEGKTNAEAARLLGCSRGTVATLLARARASLRRRLTRRGLAPSALIAASLTRPGQAARVPVALECSTVKAATAFVSGKSAAGGPAMARAAVLAEGVAKTMLVKKLTVATAILVVVGLAAGISIATFRAAAQEPPVIPQRVAESQRPKLEAPMPATPVQADEADPRSANFTVTAATPEVAERVRRAAERFRREQALLWLGRELPDWPVPCPLDVSITLSNSGGATSFAFDSGKVLSRNMKLEGGLDMLLADHLPHEVAHTILADWSGRPLPRWADEGAASLAESAASRRRQAHLLHQIMDGGRLLPLRRLLPLVEYPRDVAAFYAQSYSLAEFLVRTGGRPKFLAFVAQGGKEGWDAAAEAKYRFASVEELERAWLADARAGRDKDDRGPTEEPGWLKPPEGPRVAEADGGRASVVPVPTVVEEIRGRLPVGPAPTQALATAGRDGQLTLRRVVTAYLARGAGYEPVPVMTQEVYTLSEVRAFDPRGLAVSTRRLRKSLKSETPVLVSTDGRPVDPLYLRLVKDRSLILVLPASMASVGRPPDVWTNPVPAAPVIGTPPDVPPTRFIPPSRPVQSPKEE